MKMVRVGLVFLVVFVVASLLAPAMAERQLASSTTFFFSETLSEGVSDDVLLCPDGQAGLWQITMIVLHEDNPNATVNVRLKQPQAGYEWREFVAAVTWSQTVTTYIYPGPVLAKLVSLTSGATLEIRGRWLKTATLTPTPTLTLRPTASPTPTRTLVPRVRKVYLPLILG